MAYISNEEIEKLIEAENYFWEHSDWKKNEETEHALWNIWSVLESAVKKRDLLNKKQKHYMRGKRKEDKNYGRRK